MYVNINLQVLETTNGAQYRQEMIETADFFTNKHVGELILDTEVC